MVDSGEEGFTPNVGGNVASGRAPRGGSSGGRVQQRERSTFSSGGTSSGGAPGRERWRRRERGLRSRQRGRWERPGAEARAGSRFTDASIPPFHFLGWDHNQWTDNKIAEVEYLSAWAGSGEDHNLGWMFNDAQPGAAASNAAGALQLDHRDSLPRRDQGL